MKKTSLNLRRVKERAKKDPRVKVSFTLSSSVYTRFQKACGDSLVVSRVVEELMVAFTEQELGD